MQNLMASRAAFFNVRHSEQERIEYILNTIRLDDDGEFKRYCEKNQIDEDYGFIKAFLSLRETKAEAELNSIFEIYIIKPDDAPRAFRAQGFSKKLINIDFDEYLQLMQLFTEFTEKNKAIEKVIEELKLTADKVALKLASDIVAIDTLSECNEEVIEVELTNNGAAMDENTSCCRPRRGGCIIS